MNIRVIYRVFTDWLTVLNIINKIQIHKHFPNYQGFNFWNFIKMTGTIHLLVIMLLII